MNLTINGNKLSKNKDLLFGELINQISKEHQEDQKVISEIYINGHFLDENTEKKLLMKKISEIGNIDIRVSNPLDLAREALDSAQDYIKKIIPHCKETGELFSKGLKQSANSKFISLIDNLDSLINLITSAQAVIRDRKAKVGKGSMNDSSLRVAQIRLISAIRDLLPAHKNNDFDLLADNLINELPEALKEMDNFGIPVLKRFFTF